jgi:hypothetical protein
MQNKQILVKRILEDNNILEEKEIITRVSSRNKIGEGWLGMNFHQRQARSL